MSEFDLIYRYFKQQQTQAFYADSSVIKALGDDAAVIAWSNGFVPYTSKSVITNSATSISNSIANCQILMTTCVDTLVQGRHFSDEWSQVNKLAFAIGFKSVAVNISDICAMGAKPHSILLALALPKRLANERWLSEFAKGLFHACTVFGVRLIGGDTTRHDKLVISVTANGVMQENAEPIYRSGANLGDKVYVSGTLGDAGYALHHLDNDIGAKLAHRLHMPTPRVRLAQWLAKQGHVSAMMDVSDGLLQDLGHICHQSNVAMQINLEQLPTSKPLQMVDLHERLSYQLTGGDDYELIFTLPPQHSLSSGLDLEASTLQGSLSSDVASHDTNVPPTTKLPPTKVTCIGEVVSIDEPKTQEDNHASQNTFNIERLIELRYNGNKITHESPYPFKQLPSFAGFEHFSF